MPGATSPFGPRAPRKRAARMRKERRQPRSVAARLPACSKPGFHGGEAHLIPPTSRPKAGVPVVEAMLRAHDAAPGAP